MEQKEEQKDYKRMYEEEIRKNLDMEIEIRSLKTFIKAQAEYIGRMKVTSY